jgi:hypothetical protein
MQDFDTLRHRVEETAERLSLAQSERQEETHSLIGILRDLEEKYSAQEQQFAYYRQRLEPLERSNAQLTSLIENLLDLIDRGFGDGSLNPLRKASEMASAMLKTEIMALDDTRPDQDGNPDSEAAIDAAGQTGAETDAVISEAEPEMATLDDMDGADAETDAVAAEAEPEMATLDDMDGADAETAAVDAEAEPEMATLDDMDDSDAEADAVAAEVEPEMAAPDDMGQTDAETASESDALISYAEPEMATLDDMQEEGADDGETEAVSEAEEDVQVIQDLVELVEESPEIAGNESVVTDEDEETPVSGEDASADEQDEAQFGGVTDLELEEVALSNLEEDIDAASDIVAADIDAIAAMDMADLIAGDDNAPAVAVAEDDAQSQVDMVSGDDAVASNEIPQSEDPDLTARFEDVSDAVLQLELEEDAAAGYDDLPEIVKTASATFASGDTAEEADSIAALALAMEEETKSENAPPPAKSDIRSLMLRVEALAKKAEAMRLAQSEDTEMSEAGEKAVDQQEAATAAEPAAGTDDKKTAVA